LLSFHFSFEQCAIKTEANQKRQKTNREISDVFFFEVKIFGDYLLKETDVFEHGKKTSKFDSLTIKSLIKY